MSLLNLSAIPRESLVGRALRSPLAFVPAGIVVRVLQGPLRGARWIVGSSTHGCWLGSYERDTQATLCRIIRPGMTVFDVGANVGFFSLLAARLGARVVAFEPLPRNLAFLRRHVEMNRANITVDESAITDSEGEAHFETGRHASMGRIGDGDLVVTTTTLHAAALRHGVPDMVKMDIEGGEVAALRESTDLFARCSPAIFLSTHGSDRHRQCVELLSGIGYSLSDVGRVDTTGHRDVLATCKL